MKIDSQEHDSYGKETSFKIDFPELFTDKSSIGDFLEPNDVPTKCLVYSLEDSSQKFEKECDYQFSYLKDFGIRRIDSITVSDICSSNELC